MITILQNILKYRRRFIFLFIFLFGNNMNVFGQCSEYSIIPLSSIFHNFGRNLLNSITFNDGLNFISSGLETYTMIKSGLDWKYYQMVYGNRALANYGITVNTIGYATPAIFPIVAYSYGRINKNEKLQILGCALAQTSIMATGMNILLKGLTSRRQAGIYDLDPQTTDYSDDFQLAFFFRGVVDGWPSGHTMNIVAAAATVSEIYKDNTRVKIVAYTCAAITSIGMTFCDHWVSDVIAGWLIGYAIGKTVGRSFGNVNKKNDQRITLNVWVNYVGINISSP
jgi:hypothetical protein